MLTHSITVSVVILGIFSSSAAVGQQGKTATPSVAMIEFPVTMQQSVTAGKTPAGTKVQAKLEVATLLAGTVIPRNAVFSGEVIESTAKTKTNASRMAIRMDSVQWKTGTAPVKIHLTDWYYPAQDLAGQNLQYGPQQPANRTWNGEGQYPDPNSKVYKPFPGSESDKNSTVPDTPSSVTSNHRVQMKDVEIQTTAEGAMDLVSKKNNIKLNKLTTYVFSSGDLVVRK